MNPDPELLELCGAARDGVLTREQHERLEARLAGDAQARRFYAEFVQLHVMLGRAHPGGSTVASQPVATRAARRPWIWAAAACFALAATGAWAWLTWRPAAGLVAVRGAVTILRDGMNLAGTEALTLRAGDVVRTAPGARARVQWRREATRLDLQAGTETRLISVRGAKRLALVAGALTAEVARQSPRRPMIIETSNAKAEVLGTKFALSAPSDADKSTRLQVDEGRVLLGRAGVPETEGVIVAGLHTAVLPEQGEVEVEALPVAKTIEMGLLAHWPLDDGEGAAVRDVSGHARDAVAVNPVWKKLGNKTALRFASHGSPQRNTGVQVAGLRLPPAFTIALEVWQKPESDGLRSLVSNAPAAYSTPASKGFRFEINCPAVLRGGASGPSNDQSLNLLTKDRTKVAWILSPPEALTRGRWHSLALRINQPEKRAEIFLDGRAVASGNTLADFTLEGPLWFGCAPGQVQPFFGWMQNIRVYGRLLEDEEIEHLAATRVHP